jgi:SAM-dependent methyltransferase
VATWWSEFNDDFRPHELPYFRKFVEAGGGPALDAGCGAGRLLLPLLRAGLDVDGCDVSADMIAVCREKAEAEGLAPNLYVQAMQELDLPRRYRTIVVCGSFGLGSDREQDRQALQRLRDHLEPGGTLLLDIEVPYADARLWKYWLRDERTSLPEAARPPRDPRRGSDGADYTLSSRVVEVDPLEQHVVMEIHAERWRDGALEAAEDHRLDMGLYFEHELLLMLEHAGFGDVTVHGEHTERPPTRDDGFLVFVARK